MNEYNGIQLFEDKCIRTAWDEENETWLSFVVDVVGILTDSTDVKRYIKKMRGRDVELHPKRGTICTPVEMMVADGKGWRPISRIQN
jgi:hypothetical protein